jgi:hypothetical protein
MSRLNTFTFLEAHDHLNDNMDQLEVGHVVDPQDEDEDDGVVGGPRVQAYVKIARTVREWWSYFSFHFH